MNMRLIISIWAAIACCGNVAVAQAPEKLPPPLNNESKHSLKLRCSSLGEWTGPALEILMPEKAQGTNQRVRVPLDLADMGYSADIPVRKEVPLVLIEKGSSDEHPKVVLQVPIPPEMKQPLLLLIPTKDKIQHRWFDIDPSVFPFGSIHVVNYSKEALGIICGKEAGKCDVGGMHKISNQSIPDNQEPVLFTVGNPKSGKTYFKSMLIRRSAKRMIVFFVVDPAHPDDVPMHRMLVDFAPS